MIYGAYLALLAIVAVAVTVFGIDKKIGLWATIIIGAVLMCFWPRW